MPREVTAEKLDLSSIVKRGDTVLWGQGTGEPLTLTETLVQQRSCLGRVRTFFGASFSDTFQPPHADAIDFSSLGGVGTSSRLSAEGILEIIPCHISELPGLIRSGTIPSDVVFVQLSAADEKGRYSLGVVGDYMRTAMNKARVVVAEVNEKVPWTCGDTMIQADDLDYIVHTSRSVIELPRRPAGEVERAIAKHVASLVPDGAVLQVGIGAIPDAILASLSDRRDLGVHSGMIGDGVVELMKAGVITNGSKPVDRGVTVTGALFGTRNLYDFAHMNPGIELRSIAYTHDPTVLAQFDKLISINSAVEVDMTGQVNAEAVDGKHVGAVGGQVDFVRAAARSVDGRSIIALPSTARGGTISRIVTRLSGGVVTTARSDVDVVATEYGIAELRGASLRERARRLVGIAHPEFREKLEREVGIVC